MCYFFRVVWADRSRYLILSIPKVHFLKNILENQSDTKNLQGLPCWFCGKSMEPSFFWIFYLHQETILYHNLFYCVYKCVSFNVLEPLWYNKRRINVWWSLFFALQANPLQGTVLQDGQFAALKNKYWTSNFFQVLMIFCNQTANFVNFWIFF